MAGNWLRAALMAACTSRAAASILRFKSNCIVIDVDPRKLVDVISVTPAIRPNCRSSGVATAEPIVSGLAPGKRRVHLDRGEFDLRQRRNRQQEIAQRPDQRDRDRHQRRADRAMDERSRQTHVQSSPTVATSGSTCGCLRRRLAIPSKAR